ncbi:MAG: class I SAM-dependent DNA methyltransferase [Armatimonadetes bacterium]|nr:class I SAM-dependent DNA methyltransferase [Armatimonadota bacterium]
MTKADLQAFVKYVSSLDGDEKGEAQVFIDRFFIACGHEGYKQAGATLEDRIRKKGGGTHFADCVWKPRVLIEMKKRGEKLERHYSQAFNYWVRLVPDRPRYVVLCNFDEFWIYDFDLQVDSPMDKVKIADLPERYDAFGFMQVVDRKPKFKNNLVEVTRKAAGRVSDVYNTMVKRGEPENRAVRFLMQMVVAMYSEDSGLLPKNVFSDLLSECADSDASTYDLVGGLFRQMNSPELARAGRFKGVRYFNGGLFATIDPVELNSYDVLQLLKATKEHWGKVQPHIFGTIFEACMGTERHAKGAHFTTEADILKIVEPTIIRPFLQKVDEAKSFAELKKVLNEIRKFRVLDPACGSGNFLYVAFREMKRLESEILHRAYEEHPDQAKGITALNSVSIKQFYGIDKDPFSVELTKVTLMLAKEHAIAESEETFGAKQASLQLHDPPLPLDNLDDNIFCRDAILDEWPEFDAVIGNPPFQTKAKMPKEFGAEYVEQIRNAYPDVPGRADFCVYWLRKTHELLKAGQRAGLVGTNTIRQNYSREGGLDYIVDNGGTITEAVSSQVWSGDASVHVSIVNWVNGKSPGKKLLMTQLGDKADSPWASFKLDRIPSSLTHAVDVTKAKSLVANRSSHLCCQGQTHGHYGFLVTQDELFGWPDESSSVIHPYLTADELIGSNGAVSMRRVIDLNHCPDVVSASKYGEAFLQVKERVMPDVLARAVSEKEGGVQNGPRSKFAEKWWTFWRSRPALMQAIQNIDRYVVCGRITKRPIFEFLDSTIHPNDALVAFPMEDDYSFGVLQSSWHWVWFVNRCSTLTARYRYTSATVFDSFPWPQRPTLAQAKAVAKAAVDLRQLRRDLMAAGAETYRSLYRSLEIAGKNPLRDATDTLDAAVCKAYGFDPGADRLASLYELNQALAELESQDKDVVGPGLPSRFRDKHDWVSSDRIQP